MQVECICGHTAAVTTLINLNYDFHFWFAVKVDEFSLTAPDFVGSKFLFQG